MILSEAAVVHASATWEAEIWDGEDQSLKSAQVNSLWDAVSKITKAKCTQDIALDPK
jgi:phage-related tail protein